jgi:phage tail-like protein
MTTIPQTGTFIELDSVIGWQAATEETHHLSPVSPTGLAVDCVTGQPTPFVPALAGELGYPIALARNGHCDHTLYLLDDAVNCVKTLDLEQKKEFVTIHGFGGKGKQARRFRKPHGLAVLEDGSYVIADTRNHQVKIFSRFPHALLEVWGSGKPGNAPGEFNSPWKVVADRCGLIYIADRGNERIQRIHRDGSAEAPIVGLQSPSGLALAPDGTLAVLDSPNVYIYPPGQIAATQNFTITAASCLTFDDSGYLYVGTSTALVYKYETTADGSFRSVGIGVTGVNGQFLDLLWTPEVELVGILLPHCATSPTLVTIPVCGSYLPCGTLTTVALDSQIENCVWDRIQLRASVPKGTVIAVATQTSNTLWPKGTTFQAECSAYSPVNQNCPLALTGDNPDCLVQSLPGRYLRMQLQLKTNGVSSPTLNSVQISYPRASYLQYLPALYQEDDQSRVFLDRFLRIFQTTFDGMDRTLDQMWMMFDPLSVPDKWFNWLADWIALPINPLWTDQQRRTALKSAGQIYPLRGTPSGVQQLIKQYSGVDARLIEHFRLRQLIILPDQPDASTVALGMGTRLWSRDYYRRLQLGVYSRVGYFDLTGEPEPDIEPLAWGANEFTVFFDCDPYQVSATQNSV